MSHNERDLTRCRIRWLNLSEGALILDAPIDEALALCNANSGEA